MQSDLSQPVARPKFSDPDITAKGKPRAHVNFGGFKTLWFNTGTLCNITCVNCYIESSPTNDRLVYLTCEDMVPYLDELDRMGASAIEIGFTGGEPFLNPQIIEMTRLALARGHSVLMLTNAMRPMMRPRVQEGIVGLIKAFGDRLTFRVSLDHYGAVNHDLERGECGFEETCLGVDWLATQGAKLAIAGRTMWGEDEASERVGYRDLVTTRGWPIDLDDPLSLILFPEMDARVDVPEITPNCWSILHVDPAGLMCASARMVVKRKGAQKPAVLACTLLPYDSAFEMGARLGDALGPVKLNHPHCAKFCVLGGGSCSA
jgi:Radical SAM superfamily/4Fe-4S single cluster domain